MSKCKIFAILVLIMGCSTAKHPQKVVKAAPWFEEYNSKHSDTLRGTWDVTAYDPSLPFVSISGKLNMQSPKEFHLLLSSWFSKEVEVWSDTQRFQFWSKKHDKTFTYAHNRPNNLKGPFQPIFLEAILSPPKVDGEFTENETHWISSTKYDRFQRLLYVNKLTLNLDWVILTEKNEVVVAGKREGGSPPSKVVINWKEEDQISIWEIR